MITFNCRTDHDAPIMRQKVVQYADALKNSLVLAIEPLQWRGGIQIARPHCHLLIVIDKDGAETIAEDFRVQGFDVDVLSMYEPKGACWYIQMTVGTEHYYNRHKPSQPAAPQQQGRVGISRVWPVAQKEVDSCYEQTEVALDLIHDEVCHSALPNFPLEGSNWCIPWCFVHVSRSNVNLRTVLNMKLRSMPRAP